MFSFVYVCIFQLLLGQLILISASSTPYPSDIFHLNNFDLQIPEGKNGDITTIKNLTSHSSVYFYTDPKDAKTVNFWTPEDGTVTSNGSGPRTELSEKKEFTFSGKHTMSFTQTIFEADPNGEVCIGQVKGDSFSSGYKNAILNNSEEVSALSMDSSVAASLTSGSCLIVVELVYNAKSKELTAYFRDEQCNRKSYSLGKYNLSEQMMVTFIVDGYSVYVSSNKVKLDKYSYSFWKGANYQMHFKVGTYVQGQGSNHSKGTESKLSALTVTHS